EFRIVRSMGKNIILILNDADLREDLRPVLREMTGFSCASFATGEEAVDYVRRHPVSVALISLMLPDMSGIDCTEKLKGTIRDLEVIVMYGDGESGRIFEA